MSENNYEDLERSLIRLTNDYLYLLGEQGREDVVEFVEHGEYGLALEAAIDILFEKQEEVPAGFSEEASHIGKMMGIERDIEVRMQGIRFVGK